MRPLPPPEEARASRLPVSERVVRGPPSGGWPPEFAADFANGPLLVVLYREGLPTGKKVVAAIDDAARPLAERHVKVVKSDPGPISPLAENLRVLEYPSVLLFAKGGDLLLWREGEEPNLVAAILDLVKKE